MNRGIDKYSLQSNQKWEEKLYEHFLHSVQTETSTETLERFRLLFIQGTGYHDRNVRIALENLLSSPNSEQEFKFVFNRCCHIIINRWQMQLKQKEQIPELIKLLENALPPGTVHSRHARLLRELVRDFTETEHYLKLQRLAKVISGEDQKQNNPQHSEKIGNLIQRYPYLHQHCLLSEDSSYESQRTVKKIQKDLQNRFERDLSQYVTYRVRLAQTTRDRNLAQGNDRVPHLIQPVQNPTLLSDGELNIAINQFIGKVEDGYSYHELSKKFIDRSTESISYQAFKRDLYEYLISSIDPKYGSHKFNDKLGKFLRNTLADCHSQVLNEFLLLRTCSNLLKFLVVDSSQCLDHYLFVDMITNLGETKIIGLLLKIVLLCGKIKPYLEKRFSILFSHYESFSKEGVPWLIKSLENLQIAFSVHFGCVDLSLIKIM